MKGKQVGVIGGGQLAWMMAAEASKLGIELIVQTPSQEDPAVSRANDVVYGNIDDAITTAKLAQMCDIVTFENEFIDLEALQQLAQTGVCFRPSLDSLTPLLDKYDQRNYLQKINVPTPKFGLYSSPENIVANYGFPVVLKARRHGYDGQGTFIIKDIEGLNKLAAKIPIQELLIEEFVPFERELGIIAARNELGAIAVYPVTETFQKNQVCHWTITPADVTEEVETKVKAIARTIMEKLNVIGVFGIEFFLTKDNRVLVNEIAPRTHNSGHYTLDGCHTSQFAMQLQAVTGMSLGSTELKSAGALIVNLLGFEESDSDYQEKRDREASRRHRILEISNSLVHWYGKSSRPGRKLGHVTVILNKEELTQAKSIIEQIESIWYGNK
ncbi:5-(carboxyamino)imidazole ribonucleotide synthase [Waterburya agarophytonicola K14]|uniref:N5-carboxyaminoimidazole ribonucleotide synthase n=1 Tax=Waterburya agarophytonicola KI4 TaxID=2874699 RepID=A0A964BTG2_9CYAN|nr:5-(carboxyamino)imidazole ribonucleotide synthase [Waterburya agarophytonicola]MCC0179494.1 5-(carboxyamino)imidazole ribonucleotide synthase [Waterburya agarophytonicola KI4]